MIDTKTIRKDFPMYDKHNGTFEGLPLHYLDNAATTFKPYAVIREEHRYEEDITANAHRGDYALAHEVDVSYEGARKEVASFLNADPEEICFTSGDTFGLNEIAYGLLPLLHKGDEILLSYEEHASNVLPWFRLARMTGARICYIPLDKSGRITLDAYRKSLTDHTKIVSLATVSNVMGYLLPVKEMAALAHERHALYIADGAQSVPHFATDVKDQDVDFLVFSGHKMLGPTGIGVLYGKKELLDKMQPFFLGGEMNARFNSKGEVSFADVPLRFEAGTQNISGAMGLAEACRYLKRIGFDEIGKQETKLRKMAVEGLLANGNADIYNPESDGGIVTFNIKGVFAQDAATYLGSKGVFVRSGTHCAKILPEFLDAPATVRASLYFYNDEEDIKALVDAAKHAEDFLDAFFH
ncbi:MAG: aminotransferase class V-fold PLP-dependent enzyme [Bacilli bacterium]